MENLAAEMDVPDCESPDERERERFFRGRLLFVDGPTMRFREIQLAKNAARPVCGERTPQT